MNGIGHAVLLSACAGIAFAAVLGYAVWRMVARERRAPPVGHAKHVFPLSPRFGLALPGLLAWMLVMVLACALDLAGVEPGALPGIAVTVASVAPFAAFGSLHARRRREYQSALAAGELDEWREALLKTGRSRPAGFWATFVVVSLVSVLVVLPTAIVIAGAFGVAYGEVRGGLVALAVVLPVPVAAGAWLVPTARNQVERRQALDAATSRDVESREVEVER